MRSRELAQEQMVVEPKVTFSPTAVKALSGMKEEPEWMLARRMEAWRIYEETPMPTLKDEEWRRTDIRGLRLSELIPGSDPVTRVKSLKKLPALAQSLLDDGSRKGGILAWGPDAAYSYLRPGLAQQGVIFTDLGTAVQKYPELVREYFMTQCVSPAYSKFSALHGAFASGGAFLHVPEGVEITLPFYSLMWMSEVGRAVFAHTLIVLERGASATFLDEYVSPPLGGQSFQSGVTEIILKEGARLFYMSLQNWGPEVWDISVKRALLEKDSSLESIVVSMGGELAKANVEMAMVGPGVKTNMLGLYFAGGRQHFDHHTLQDHIAPHDKSDLLYKGVLTGRSRTVFSGLIRVHPNAQKTDAYQANRNLVLSKKARADSIPNLEIMANDVRCTHGATVGQLDEEQLFYLMSRGLPRPEAVKLLVDGFFHPVLDRIPWPKVQERLGGLIQARMPQELTA